MKIEHIGLLVYDLERERQFFEKYFYAQSGEKYHNPKTGFQSYFLIFEEGARLEICTQKGLRMSMFGKKNLMGYAHLAISLGSLEAVDAKASQLAHAGYKLLSGPRTTGDGYYEAVILDQENNEIELTI